jgi:hypothetical protein
MDHGYECRAELIRDHWKRYGGPWNAGTCPRFKMPIRHKDYPYVPAARDGGQDMKDHLVDWVIEFAFERGVLDGRPAYRITCEGIVVEEAPITLDS